MEEGEYKSTYGELTSVRCVFEKALTNHRAKCRLAKHFCLADREGYSCEDAESSLNCAELLEKLRKKSALEFGPNELIDKNYDIENEVQTMYRTFEEAFGDENCHIAIKNELLKTYENEKLKILRLDDTLNKEELCNQYDNEIIKIKQGSYEELCATLFAISKDNYIHNRVSEQIKGMTLSQENIKKIETKEELVEYLIEKAKKGTVIQRYKGLGEMNPEQLTETTKVPDKRLMSQVQMEDAVYGDKVFEMLMGGDVAPLKHFIQTHAKSCEILDVYIILS